MVSVSFVEQGKLATLDHFRQARPKCSHSACNTVSHVKRILHVYVHDQIDQKFKL